MTTSYVDALAETRTSPLIQLEHLHPHPHNPRRDLGDLTELADSIRAHGIRQDLLVVPNPDALQGGWRIVIGHRRHAAAALAGADTVPVRVDTGLDEVGQRELMLVENLPVEEADAYQGLLDLGVSQAAIAKQTGRAIATVRSRLKIRTLSEVLANNKASRAAAAVREEFVRGLLALTRLPDGWAAYAVAMSLSREVYGEHVRAGELLNLGKDWPGGDAIATLATTTTDVPVPRTHFAQKYLIATAVARGEDKLPVDFWRTCFDKPTAVRHLLWLRRWGYTLSDLEQAFVDEHRSAAPELADQ